MFKHILIPTDGTDLSRKAVIYGVQLARTVGAHVTAITISEPYHVASMDAVLVAETPEEHDAQTARIAERALEQVRMAAEAACVAVETVREIHDQPYRAIIECALARKLRPDRHGVARSARRRRAAGRQRDRQGADPQHDPGAGLSVTATRCVRRTTERARLDGCGGESVRWRRRSRLSRRAALPVHFTAEEMAARKLRLLAAMAERRLDGMLLFAQESDYWLTGYDSFGFCFFQCLYVGG